MPRLGALIFVSIWSSFVFATSEVNSRNIEMAVKGIEKLAGNGVRMVRVKKAATVKEMLFNLAVKEKHIDSEEDFGWVGADSRAWDADELAWGETNMKQAYAYIFGDQENEDSMDPKEKEKLEKIRAKGRESFKLFLNSGVQFGVVPLGAIQCGVTFAALAIIDPATGKVYIFSKEGSGC